MICIAGTPPLHAMQGNALLHHSLADGNFDNVMNCFRQFTVAQALITPENAATEIPRVIACAWQRKKPVYLQLPSDICEVEIEVADNPARIACQAAMPAIFSLPAQPCSNELAVLNGQSS